MCGGSTNLSLVLLSVCVCVCGGSTHLALRLLGGERSVLLLLALLLGFLALGQVLVPEVGQEALPALCPELRVFSQLPLDHERLCSDAHMEHNHR